MQIVENARIAFTLTLTYYSKERGQMDWKKNALFLSVVSTLSLWVLGQAEAVPFMWALWFGIFYLGRDK